METHKKSFFFRERISKKNTEKRNDRKDRTKKKKEGDAKLRGEKRR